MAAKGLFVTVCLVCLSFQLQTSECRNLRDGDDNYTGDLDVTHRIHRVRTDSLNARERNQRKRVRFTVRLTLPNLEMTSDLKDRNSDRYRKLTKRLRADLERLFVKTPGTQRVYNMRFSKPMSRPVKLASSNRIDTSNVAVVDPNQKLSQSSASEDEEEAANIDLAKLPSPSSSSSSSSKNLAEDVEWDSSSLSSAESSSSSTFLSLTEQRSTSPTFSVRGEENTAFTPHESEPKHSPTPSSPPEDGSFNVPSITRSFKDCFGPVDEQGNYVIELKCYVQAYSKLLEIFNLLGSVFSFAGDDVRSKLDKLTRLRQRDMETSDNHYETFQNMFAYEFSQEGAKAEREGVDANRWIHRALRFISGVVRAAAEEDDSQSMQSKAREIYDRTMAPHHDWYVRMGVYVALVAVPSREYLMTKMNVPDNALGAQQISDLTSVIDAVYDEVEKLYVRYTHIEST